MGTICGKETYIPPPRADASTQTLKEPISDPDAWKSIPLGDRVLCSVHAHPLEKYDRHREQKP